MKAGHLIAAGVVLAGVLGNGLAWADRGAGTGLRTPQGGSTVRGLGGGTATPRRTPGDFGQHRGGVPGFSGGNRSGGQDLANLFDQRASGRYPLAEALFNEYSRNNRRDAEKEQARAYRDAAIAGAIANVLGTVITVAAQPRYAAAPAPVVCTPPPVCAPAGRVELQRVLVREGYTEEYRVWVPEYVVQSTGEVILGHYETRRRSVPPVYETREVWVPYR